MRALFVIVSVVAMVTLPAVHGQEQALILGGGGDYVDVPHDPVLAPSGAMTVEAWIRLSAYPTWPAEIVNKKRRYPWGGFTLHLMNGYLQFATFGNTPGPSYTNVETSWSIVNLGQWTHVAGVTDGSSVQLLVNGVVRDSVPNQYSLVGADSNPLRIGLDSEAPAYNSSTWFEGQIDEVRYWSIARSPAQIRQTMYQELDGAPGLIAAWHLDGNALDLTGGHHGHLAGNAGFVASNSPVTCPGSTLCYTLNTPITLGTVAMFQVASPTIRVFTLSCG